MFSLDSPHFLEGYFVCSGSIIFIFKKAGLMRGCSFWCDKIPALWDISNPRNCRLNQYICISNTSSELLLRIYSFSKEILILDALTHFRGDNSQFVFKIKWMAKKEGD